MKNRSCSKHFESFGLIPLPSHRSILSHWHRCLERKKVLPKFKLSISTCQKGPSSLR